MPPQTNGQPPAVKNVGYIGLGNAGFSMASNLPKAGYNLVVHDVDDAKVQKAAKEWKNTKAANGKPEAFADCEVIVTMLPQGKIVREVLLGKDNFASALKPGTIIIDTSSSSPFDTIALGKELAAHQITLVDSPITQTYMHATDNGESTLMVGSDDRAAFEKAEPIIRTMAGYVFYMGKLGNGHAMKTLNNYIMASSICALADSLVTGQKYGLDPQQMIDVLNVGTGVCFPTLDTFRRDGITQRYNSGFGLALLVKDLGITEEFMKHNGFETELPALTKRYLGDALKEVEPMADHTAALVGWEKRSGVKLKKTEKAEDIPAKDFEHRLKGLNRSADI
ncbi:putative 3-hydroxyisobutyrate dehydrogenase, mitochondrial [Pseudocercospora fuligena]|uniref:3-hydroxyisobutyrate dehydrogenase n=1 Tax=Pseudocercospora fuligena TaxID=685502 RepID=A0A8H6VED5_9PEZI|nr:putative 3-hydroxyisobutyrate dehydrogenase, mitochondrial [Pseudocercospora fuligena]